MTTSFLGPITRLGIADPEVGEVIADVMSVDADGLRPGDDVRIRLRDDVERTLILKGDTHER
jgi:hypothetical protein